jgi:hypothetical protein
MKDFGSFVRRVHEWETSHAVERQYDSLDHESGQRPLVPLDLPSGLTTFHFPYLEGESD